MYKHRKNKVIRVTALILTVAFLSEIFSPTVAFALTSGPNAPEFSSFEPVATTDMVNVFSGDFTYNLPVIKVPGPEGDGYDLSLSYHSGGSAEEEASWVGYGWTLNPGAINRDVRGFPDEWSGEQVTYYNKTKPNWSASVTKDVGLDAFSLDVSLGASRCLRYNNYQGYSKNIGMNVGFKGMVNLGMNVSDGEYTFSANINPVAILRGLTKKQKKKDNEPKQKKVKEVKKSLKDQLKAAKQKLKNAKKKDFVPKVKMKNNLKYSGGQSFGTSYGLFTHSEAVRSMALTPYTGLGYNWSSTIQANPSIPVGVEVGQKGNFNIQGNAPIVNRSVYGYMHNKDVAQGGNVTVSTSGIGFAPGEDAMTDYYLEKDNPYNKRNNFIGIPFNNADNFSVSGEGVSGGFRMYDKRVGHYRPNYTKSEIKTRQMGLEIGLGANLEVGFDFGIGKQYIQNKQWDVANAGGDYEYSGSGSLSDYVFRFNNDLGGSIDYSSNTGVSVAKFETDLNIPGVKNFKPRVPSDVNTNASGMTQTGGSSSYINPNSGLSTFEIYNDEGNKYVYSLPVYNKNELNIQVDIDNAIPQNNYLVAHDANESDPIVNKTVVGEKRSTPYASSYLLTQIISPEYVDANGNGAPDDDDFGSWTKFDYRKVYGDNSSQGSWYNWRIPYNGLTYAKNQISDKNDDMGGLNIGEKEVNYLKVIETKTHVAFFITNETVASDFASFGIPSANQTVLNGSGIDRPDGLGGAAGASASTTMKGTQKLEKLEKIILFAKGRYDKPIKIVNFEYDNSLVQGLPNSTATGAGSGKLTLKKIWFEYEGIYNAKISPYEFKYEYHTNYPAQLQSKYPDIAGTSTPYALLNYYAQNPNYEPYNMDMWGHHQYDGAQRHIDMKPWVYQGAIPSTANYDPAAWQLKQIVLPSGGEIHIQYEEKDYRYVQDRKAMAMVSLTSSSGTAEYHINLADLGYNPSDPGFANERDALKDAITAEYLGPDKKKMFFKFLYGLKSGVTPSLSDNCTSEYIDGYVDVSGVSASGNEIIISITDDGEHTPKGKCLQYVRSQKGGKLNCSTNYDGFDADLTDAYLHHTGNVSDASTFSFDDNNINEGGPNKPLPRFVKQIAKGITGGATGILPTLSDDTYDVPELGDVGEYLPSLSYVRVPLVKDKRGGGIRVKRLLMYDPGMETGDAVLYGSEYEYKGNDGLSSGVAVNEPSGGKEESPLVYLIPRKSQSLYSQLTAGEDKTELEGPLGESIISSPSIGYSRVVTKNIHSGNTGTGFSVNEFYTAKDYAFDRYYSTDDVVGKGFEASELSSNSKKDFLQVPAGLINYSKSKQWLAQGFRFIINSMHGQTKATYTYGGTSMTPTANGSGGFNSPDAYLTSAQEFTYFEPGEKITLMYGENGGIKAIKSYPGKEMDLCMDMRSIEDKNIDLSLELDVSITLAIPPPIFVTACVSMDLHESAISSHSISKVTRYPAIIKSVRAYQDGSWSVTDNLGFDYYTGNKVLTRTYDGFDKLMLADKTVPHDGAFYSMNIPAAWYYTAMRPKWISSSNTNQLKLPAGTVVSYGINGNPFILAPGTSPTYVNIGGPLSPTPLPWFGSPQGIVSAEAMEYSNSWNWGATDLIADYSTATAAASNPIFRLKANYAYKDEIVLSSNQQGTNKIWDGGIFNTFSLFDWQNPSNSSNNWIKVNEVTMYSPDGEALEEVDITGIYSAAKYGYKKLVPVLIGKNTKYAASYFYDFEYNSDYSGSPVIVADGHSGKQSLDISVSVSSGYTMLSNINLTSTGLATKGAAIKLWLKSSTHNLSGNLRAVTSGGTVPFTKVATLGDWSLYEVNITNWSGATSSSIALKYNAQGGEQVLMDDFRFQPIDAQVTSYVYDNKSLRLIAQFDDRNFGLFYQYNDEGKLIRKMVETERGMKTITETHYNTESVLR